MTPVLPAPGDIIEVTREVITGVRRRNKPRGYDAFHVTETKKFRAVVKIGAFREYAHVLYYTTPTKESYPSYFFGTGRKTDVPKIIESSLDSIIKKTDIFAIVGRIDDNPELLIDGYLDSGGAPE